MASYTAPTPAQLKGWTGIDVAAVKMDAAALNSLLDELLRNAESEVALVTGEGIFDSTSLTDRQSASLCEAVACGTGARFLQNPQVLKACGTHKPLMAESSADVGEVIESLDLKARRLARLVASGGGVAETQVLSSFGGCQERAFTREGDLG